MTNNVNNIYVSLKLPKNLCKCTEQDNSRFKDKSSNLNLYTLVPKKQDKVGYCIYKKLGVALFILKEYLFKHKLLWITNSLIWDWS